MLVPSMPEALLVVMACSWASDWPDAGSWVSTAHVWALPALLAKLLQSASLQSRRVPGAGFRGSRQRPGDELHLPKCVYSRQRPSQNPQDCLARAGSHGLAGYRE